MDRKKMIQILTEIQNGNRKALLALNDGNVYLILNHRRFTKNGIAIPKEQFEKQVSANPYVRAVQVKTISTGVPLAYSEKEVEERMKQEGISI